MDDGISQLDQCMEALPGFGATVEGSLADDHWQKQPLQAQFHPVEAVWKAARDTERRAQVVILEPFADFVDAGFGNDDAENCSGHGLILLSPSLPVISRARFAASLAAMNNNPDEYGEANGCCFSLMMFVHLGGTGCTCRRTTN